MNDLMSFHYASVMIMGVAMATLSLTIFGMKSASFVHNDTLRRSRFCFAFGFFCIAVNCFVHAYTGFRFTDPSLGVALDISSYYLLCIFYTFTYMPLLDETYANRARVMRFVAMCLACNTCMWMAALVVDGILSFVLQIVGGLMFLLSTLDVSVALYRRYHNVSNLLTETNVANVENFSHFLYRSLVLIIITGLCAVIVSILNNIEVQCYFNLFSTLMFWQLFMAFNNYIISLQQK